MNSSVIIQQPQPRWRPLDARQIGLMTTLGDMLERAEGSFRDGLPDLRSSDTLFVLSDHGGEHENATHRVLSVLVFNPFSLREWDQDWQPIRKHWLQDGRRLAFKRLGDQRRAAALPGFLAASERIEGLLFSLAVNRRIQPLFDPIDQPSLGVPGLPAIDAWKERPLYKLLFAIHVASLLLAGLSGAGQDVFWYTDEDEIAPNVPRLYDACEFFARISSHYLPHRMRHFRFGTAKSDDGSRRLEDLLALPDLAAGVTTELLGAYIGAKLDLRPSLVLPIPESIGAKSRILASWLAATDGCLRKLIFAFEPDETSKGLLVRRLRIDSLT